MDLRDQRITQFVSEFSDQGIHRTGTQADLDCAHWMSENITAMGLRPVLQDYPFQRLDIKTASVQIGDLHIEALPLFDCTTTGEKGISGVIGELGGDCDIGYTMVTSHAGTKAAIQLEEARATASHKAIIAVTDTHMPANGIAALNAEHYLHPYGPPVLQIANDHWVRLKEAASTGMSIRVIAHCIKRPGRLVNVMTRIKGKTRSLPPLVIMTPRSGWWRCAAERGGGIACFFECMQALVSSKPGRDVIFTANAGHELDHLGLDRFLKDHCELISSAFAWIHLGANFATAVAPRVMLQYSDEDLHRETTSAMSRHDAAPDGEAPIGTRPFGEARNISDGGGRYVSIIGANGLFHHPQDTWPDSVDLVATRKWVDVFVDLATRLSH